MGLFSSKNQSSKNIPEELVQPYESICRFLSITTDLDIATKRELIQKQVDILNIHAVSNTFKYLIYPEIDSKHYKFVIISGIFGPFSNAKGSTRYASIGIIHFDIMSYLNESHLVMFDPAHPDTSSSSNSSDSSDSASLITEPASTSQTGVEACYDAIIDIVRDESVTKHSKREQIKSIIAQINGLDNTCDETFVSIVYPYDSPYIIISGVYKLYSAMHQLYYLSFSLVQTEAGAITESYELFVPKCYKDE